jgi:hypothetical protein
MATNHIDIIRNKLKEYSERGVFRGFKENAGRNGKVEFTFTWLLDKPFTLVADTKTGSLQMKNLLPHVPSKSDMDKDLKEFVAAQMNQKQSAHNRVDAKRADLKCTNRLEKISLTLDIKKNQYSYGVTKLLNTTNKLFGHLQMYHLPYLWEHFEVPEE